MSARLPRSLERIAVCPVVLETWFSTASEGTSTSQTTGAHTPALPIISWCLSEPLFSYLYDGSNNSAYIIGQL